MHEEWCEIKGTSGNIIQEWRILPSGIIDTYVIYDILPWDGLESLSFQVIAGRVTGLIMRHELFMTAVLLFVSTLVWPEPTPVGIPGEPELSSIFPLGGQRGSIVEVQIRGKNLEGANGVWLANEDLAADIKNIEELKPREAEKAKKKAPFEYQVSLQIRVNPNAALGPHPLRLVSPLGVSNQVFFLINDEPAINEVQTPHQSYTQAQPISFPLVVNGRITSPGEVDLYGVDIPKAKEVKFELTISNEAAANRFRPQLALYQIQGSWLDPLRAVRLAFTDQIQGTTVVVDSDPRERAGTRLDLRYQASKEGRYYLEVGSLFGRGSLDQIYQLRIVPDEESSDDGSRHDEAEWRERTFTRKLESDWLRTLWSRAGGGPKTEADNALRASAAQLVEGKSEHTAQPVAKLPASTSTDFAVLKEKEPNSDGVQAQDIPIPALLEGSVDRLNDIDTYRFKVSRGQRLAFEIETPKTTTPRFNPLLTVLDPKEAEVLSNLQRAPEYKSITTPFLKSLNAKVIGTFEQEGEYYLKIQDITSRNGDPSFNYRVLVRPQIPHVGQIDLETRTRGLEDGKADPYRINLIAGQAKKVTLITEHEEGFYNPSNMVSVHAEGLPEGVDAFAAASSYSLESRVREGAVFKEDSFLPKKQNVTVVLQARSGAPLTRMPVNVRFFVQAIVDGKVGPRLPVKEIPIMVVEPPQIKSARRSNTK